MSFFRILCLLSIFIGFSAGSSGQDTLAPSPLSVNLNTGITLSRLINDSINEDLTNVALPAIGLNFRYNLTKKLSTQFGLQFSQRGANSSSGSSKLRAKYIDFHATGQYKFLEFLIMEAGLQYANLFKQERIVLEGTFESGVSREPIYDYSSQLEIIMGAALEFERGIELNIRYSLPYQGMQYSNFQINLNFNLNYFKIPERRIKFKNINDALKLSDHCKHLVLQRKGLKEVPPEVFQLEHLEELHLDGNEIKTIPPEISQLKKLRILSVEFNHIDSLPKEIGQLENLEELFLHHNHLKYLPPELFELNNLMYLYIGKNQLEMLPPNVGNCSSLVELDVARSGVLLELPVSINNLVNLDRLYIDRNTIMPIPFYKPSARLQIILKDNPEYR
jgi:hypothetical protein